MKPKFASFYELSCNHDSIAGVHITTLAEHLGPYLHLRYYQCVEVLEKNTLLMISTVSTLFPRFVTFSMNLQLKFILQHKVFNLYLWCNLTHFVCACVCVNGTVIKWWTVRFCVKVTSCSKSMITVRIN